MERYVKRRLVTAAVVLLCLCGVSQARLSQAPKPPQAPEIPPHAPYEWTKWQGTKDYLSLLKHGREVGMFDINKGTYHPVKEGDLYGPECKCPIPAPGTSVAHKAKECGCKDCKCTPDDHCGCLNSGRKVTVLCGEAAAGRRALRRGYASSVFGFMFPSFSLRSSYNGYSNGYSGYRGYGYYNYYPTYQYRQQYQYYQQPYYAQYAYNQGYQNCQPSNYAQPYGGNHVAYAPRYSGYNGTNGGAVNCGPSG